MATSQFTIYQSSDAGAPGYITGLSGSLITILDACLLYGYGSKASAGWTQSFATTASIACYTQPSGSGFTVVINDNGSGSGQGSMKEATATGWEVLAGLTATIGSGSRGSGSGQFPLPTQNVGPVLGGKVMVRKSVTMDVGAGGVPLVTPTIRPWVLFADAYTFYLFILTGDPGTLGATITYSSLWFGDVFSLAGSSDSWRCFIVGRLSENSAGTTAAIDSSDWIAPGVTSPSQLTIGHYMARAHTGASVSMQVNKIGDIGKSSAGATSPAAMVGAVQTPNSTDNSIYLSPLWVNDPNSGLLRGRVRGMYMPCHAAVNFSDGQTFQGSNEYAGKTFRVVKGGYGGGVFVIETSNTVETN